MKIGFFGAGNMASAIVGGAVSSGNFKAEDISVFSVTLMIHFLSITLCSAHNYMLS